MKQDIETIPSAWKGHRGFANWLVQYLQPKITVELGVDYGYSTFVLAENNPGKVYGIDTFEGDAHAGQRDLAQYQSVLDFKNTNGFDNVHLLKDTFDNVNSTWIEPIDILHIDGLHTGDAVTHDLINWSKFFHYKTVVLIHDVSSFKEVEDVYLQISQPKLRFVHSGGLGILCQDASIIESIKRHWAADAFYEYELLESNPNWPKIRERYYDDRNIRYTTI
jgi:hypothetical protein